MFLSHALSSRAFVGEELDLLSLPWKDFGAGWKLVNLWNLSGKGAKAVGEGNVPASSSRRVPTETGGLSSGGGVDGTVCVLSVRDIPCLSSLASSRPSFPALVFCLPCFFRSSMGFLFSAQMPAMQSSFLWDFSVTSTSPPRGRVRWNQSGLRQHPPHMLTAGIRLTAAIGKLKHEKREM